MKKFRFVRFLHSFVKSVVILTLVALALYIYDAALFVSMSELFILELTGKTIDVAGTITHDGHTILLVIAGIVLIEEIIYTVTYRKALRHKRRKSMRKHSAPQTVVIQNIAMTEGKKTENEDNKEDKTSAKMAKKKAKLEARKAKEEKKKTVVETPVIQEKPATTSTSSSAQLNALLKQIKK